MALAIWVSKNSPMQAETENRLLSFKNFDVSDVESHIVTAAIKKYFHRRNTNSKPQLWRQLGVEVR